ncbi:MAG: hemerythrin family protein [Firmicutes bacterium]|nr:hemerythrin family protein [Bacillota bacterium]
MMWKEMYRIGVDKIDEQHQELFRRVEEFLRAVKGAGQWEEKLAKVKDTLAFMQGYVVEHFQNEEEYQREINYPGYEQHHKIHEEFKFEVNKYAQKFAEKGYTEEFAQEFAGKLMTWLINHVAMTDQKIGQYVRKGGQ